MVEISIPPTFIDPLLISHSLAASRAQVLFPEPEGPTRAVTSPSFAVKLTFLRTSALS